MATFGIYQVLDPLYVTPKGSVNSGKIVGGEDAGRIAVKIFNPPKPDPDEPNWEPKYFLDRAQVQRRVAAAGGAHWAPIYSLGFTPEGGAYYVTDYHALTAQKMIDGRVPLDAAALHAIVRSVVSGLEEIRRIASRSHANLKASNVLLVGQVPAGAADELRAVLSDPGQEYKAQKDGEAGDLRALGALIHELVLYRPPSAAEDVASAADPPWERLGDKAEGWRRLCADLLSHPIPPRAATLAAAGKAVDALAPPRLKVPHLRLPGRSRRGDVAAVKVPASPPREPRPRAPHPPSKLKRRIVQAAAVVLLVGGGLGALSLMEARAREEVCVAREGWFGSLASGLAEPERRERFEADPHLRRVAEGVKAVEDADLPCTSGRPRWLGFIELPKTRGAVAALRQVERELAPESWPQLTRLRELARTFEQRGWQQPAGFVAQLVEGVRPTPAVSTALSRPTSTTAPNGTNGKANGRAPSALHGPGTLAQRVDRVLRLRAMIEEQAAAADPEWKSLDERAAELAGSADPVVHGFGELLRREAVSAIKLTDDGFDGLAQLKLNAGLAAQVIEQLRTGPPGQVDTVRFAEEVVRHMNPADLEMANVRRWLSERPLYAVKRDQIAQAADALQKDYETTSGEVAKSAPEPGEAAAFELELKSVEAALRDFRHTPFIERDVTAGKFGEQVAQIQSQIGGLKRYYHAEDAADWLANLAPFTATSTRLKDFWQAWVTNLKGDVKTMADDRDLFTRNKARTDKLRDVLTELEITLPQPPGDLSEGFADAALRRREDRLGALIEAVDLADPAIKPETLKDSARVMGQWFTNLKALNEDFPVRKRLLGLDDRPDERWRKEQAFWTDDAVQRLVRADVDRIERLQKLRTASRQDLLRAAQAEGVRNEVVLAAWQLLGENGMTPPWPATVEEFNAEATLRGRVAGVVDAMDAEQRRMVEELLAREGPRRWRRFVEAADQEAVLAVAIERRQAFLIDPFVLQDMSPVARFNVWLYLANQAILDNNAAGLNVVIENLEIAAKELGDQSAHQSKAAAVLEKLAKLQEPDPFADRNLADVFDLPLPGVQQQPVQFRRVEPTDGARPFYLGTREITFAQFAGAIEGLRLWEEARKLSWPYQPGKGDARRGSRVWEWTATTPASPAAKLVLTEYWMTRDDVNRHNDFPAELHPESKFNRNVISPKFGGMPTDRHPMQYVSAQAALYYANALGCRLPTSAEWNAALAAGGKTAKDGGWNLRDAATWDTFAKHATKNGIAAEHWPDRGAFPGEPAAGAPPVAARPGAGDGILLFRPAGSEAGSGFQDLVGNVAEFVCDVPDALARWESKRTAGDFKQFLTDTPDAIGVIGGSALSPAGNPVDKPARVKRTDLGYSDVGVRLAFTAPARNLAERLKWVLAGEDYVWPRTASADTRGR